MNSTFERDPKKRRVKPVEGSTSLLDFDLEESSDDSDFRIEDHAEISDDDSLDSNEDAVDDSDEEDSEEDSEDSEDEVVTKYKLPAQDLSVADVLFQAVSQQADNKLQFDKTALKIFICCGCLGDRSDDTNEIVECDGCGVTVHEGCYGVSDTASVSSTVSSCSTEPWFCEACRAGVFNPTCELCPNSGGIFKETDVGKWVHLVCALYVPGVAFGEVDQLTSVTLFEMPYSRWGAKTCCLCTDQRFARTGVCIGCDAGMCRTYFHVTCAQREGFLSEAHSEEVDQADPFYAHCKLHSDKTLVRRRKRNWLALQMRIDHWKLQREQDGHKDTPEQLRIQRKLNKYRQKFLAHKTLKSAPWVPTQKMPRLLTTSASACRKLLHKAELMGIDTVALEMQETQIAALMDVRKKWHIPPAFNVEFIGYYLDRNTRLASMKRGLEELLETNARLLEEQKELRAKYDKMMKESTDQTRINISLKQVVHKYHSAILTACPNKSLPSIDDLGKPASIRAHPPTTMAVPTAAALKMGVGFPLNNIPAGRHDSGRVLSSHAARQENLLLNNECGICRQRRDQHLLAKCDTCHLYYHLGCLNPPLTRLPKKSKLYGWQCSECDKTSGSEAEIEVKSPRRSRTRYSRETAMNESQPENNFTPKVIIKPVTEPQPKSPQPLPITTYSSPTKQSKQRSPNMKNTPLMSNNPIVSELPTTTNTIISSMNYMSEPSPPTSNTQQLMPNMDISQLVITSNKSGKKRRRDKHRNRYSPDMQSTPREHKHKRKKKSIDIEPPPPVSTTTTTSEPPHPRITIKIKSIPLPAGEKASLSKPQMFYVPNENNEIPSSVVMSTQPQSLPATPILSPRTSASRQTPLSQSMSARKPKESDNLMSCDVCNGSGTPVNLVRCDECLKGYHFTCLDPPVKKSPKRRGYSWHCADCDPTASESN